MKILFLPILCVLLMIGIIIFEQTTMEIYAYGYVINRNTREKDLNEKKINQKIYKKKINRRSDKIKCIFSCMRDFEAAPFTMLEIS